MAGDLAPFVWAYRNCDFCIVTIYDKDIGALRDDLLFVAKRAGVELRWRRRSAAVKTRPSGIICVSLAFAGFAESYH